MTKITDKRHNANEKKLCILLPSRVRPEGLQRALDSYERNKTDGYSDIYFAFQNPQVEYLQDNINIVKEKYPNNFWLVGDIGFLNKINLLVEKYPDYGAYMILNDDQIIHTKGFDKILMDKLDELEEKSGHRLWILHWKDGIHNENLCQSFLTKEMKEVFGTYYPKGYMRHLFSDNMYHFIGQQLGILNYIPEIFIEHLHVVNQKAPMDESYAETNSQDRYRIDGNEYARWLNEKGIETLTKVLNIIEKDESKRKEKIEQAKEAIKIMLTPPTESLKE